MTYSTLDNPVFIIGTQRSGTTLLSRILTAHPRIFIQNEINVKKIFSDNITKTEIIENLNTQIELRHGLNIDNLLAKQGKDIFGIKDPELTVYLYKLQLFIPNSKFILIIRDGRAVVNSYKENKWGLGTNAYTGAIRWKIEVQAQQSFMDKYPENFLLIRFEDLVANLEKTVRKICEHLDITFDEKILEYNKIKAHFVKNASNINTDQMPNQKYVEKWKSRLSGTEIDIIESVAGDILLNYDYPLQGKSISLNWLQIQYFKLHQLILGELEIQYRLKMPRIKRLFKTL